MTSEQSSKHNKSKRKKRDKIYPNKENNNDKKAKKEESQKIQLPEFKIYDPEKNPDNIILADNNNTNSLEKDKERIIFEAKQITNYYLELHKNMMNTINVVSSQLLQKNSILSVNVFFTNTTEQFLNYQLEMKNMYTRFISNRDESLKLVDNIITNNLDTFIKSLELIQKFYKDIIESYLNCIKNYTDR
jgi:hypothetical protein